MNKNAKQLVEFLEAFTGITLEDICREATAKTPEEENAIHNENLAKMFDHTLNVRGHKEVTFGVKDYISPTFEEFMEEPHEV